MMKRKDIKVGARLRLDKNGSAYTGSWSCHNSCTRAHCFMHHLNEGNGIVRVVKMKNSTGVCFDKKLECADQLYISQVESIFSLVAYNWKKL